MIAACGSRKRGAPAVFERLNWTYAGPPPASSIEPVQRWSAAQLLELARVDGAEPTLRKQGLFLSGGEQLRIHLPGVFDADVLRQVRIVCASARDISVRGAFQRDGSPVWVAPAASAIPGSGAELRVGRVDLDFPVPPREGARFDALELAFQGKGSSVLVHSIELHAEPLLLRLPPADAPRRVRIDDEERHGFGVSSTTAAEALVVPSAGAQLSLAFGIPAELAPPKTRLGVRISVFEGDTLLEERGFQAEGRWRQECFSLDPWRGRELVLRLSVDADEDVGESVCAFAETAIVGAVHSTEPAPTVLLVTSDTHRADHLFVARRGIDVATPHLDELAARGVLFEDCFSTTNVTNPSHIAIMTATHPRDHGIFDNTTPLSQRAPTLAEAFRDAGWRTWAAVSARHLTHTNSGLGQGFDRFALARGRKPTGDRALDNILGWLPDAEGQPLFCWLHVFDAHAPYEPPAPFDGMYYAAGRDPFDPSLPEPERPAGYPQKMMPGLRDLEFPRAQYRAEVSYVDELMGRLFEVERVARGVVAFTADHGESLGEHAVWWNHAELYSATVHVPLILRWPGGPAGVRVAAPVEHLDLGRTLLDLAGLAQSAFPGTSFVDRLEDDSRDPRFSLAAHATSAAVTLDGWHLILWLKRTQEGTGPERLRHSVELFDLARDPACSDDRTEAERGRAARLRTLLIRWLNERRALDWASRSVASAEDLQDLAALGYTGADEDADTSMEEACDCEQCARW